MIHNNSSVQRSLTDPLVLLVDTFSPLTALRQLKRCIYQASRRLAQQRDDEVALAVPTSADVG